MKLSLVVLTQGKTEGKVIPITLAQFVIGRDPQCQLRPASALISKRHCALLMRERRVFVRDFESTNGTFVNDQPVKGEVELHHEDRLRVGPLTFGVRIEAAAPVNRPVPPSAVKKPAAPSGGGDPDSIAAMLLSMDDETGPGATGTGAEVPEGSTVMDVMVPPGGTAPASEEQQKKDKEAAEKAEKAKNAQGATSSAAKEILEKYWKRPR